jgi:hypothetical protein
VRDSGSIGGGLARGDSGLSTAISSVSMVKVEGGGCDVGEGADNVGRVTGKI